MKNPKHKKQNERQIIRNRVIDLLQNGRGPRAEGNGRKGIKKEQRCVTLMYQFPQRNGDTTYCKRVPINTGKIKAEWSE